MKADKEPRKVVKEVPGAVLYSDGTILVKDVRLSYPHLGKAYESKDDDGNDQKKFSLKGAFPKDRKEAMRLIKGEIDRVMKENKAEDLASDRKFLRNGDDMGKPEFKGMYVISASDSNRPHLRDRAAKKVEPESADRMFYGGCWANVLINPWWQNNKRGGKRVNANLSAVQFVRDDEPFGTERITDEDVDQTFAPVGDGDSGFDDDDHDLDDL
jgi:hypothetical protein